LENKTTKLKLEELLASVEFGQGAIARTAACAKLFSRGYDSDKKGDSDTACLLYEKAIELIEGNGTVSSRSLPENSIAAFAFNHGKSLISLGRPRFAVAAFRRALESIETTINSSSDFLWMERKALALSWLAQAQRKSGLHEEAVASYQTAIKTWKSIDKLVQAPTSAYLNNIAACLMGRSRAELQLGHTEKAARSKSKAESSLRKSGLLSKYLL